MWISVSHVSGQDFRDRYLHYGWGLGAGTHFSIDFSLQYISRSSYSISLLGRAQFRKARDIPDDFRSGLAHLFLKPQDELKEYGFAVGKVWKIPNKKMRLHLRAGPVYVNHVKKVNFTQLDNAGGAIFLPIAPNYTWQEEERNTVGLTLNPTVEFLFNNILGLSTGLFANINNLQSSIGIGCSLILGRIAEKNR